MKKIFIIILSILSLYSCTKEKDTISLGEIVFSLKDPVKVSPISDNIDFSNDNLSVSSKINVVDIQALTKSTSLSSFYCSATKGTSGSEVSVFNSVQFSGSGVYTGGRVWPVSNDNYHFYASSNAITFTASGSTVSVSPSDGDVVCAYLENSNYRYTNFLEFEHIMSKLGTVTVSAETGHTVSAITVTMQPYTQGTYNMATKAWSSKVSSTKTISESSVGSKVNDFFFVPGAYDITISWTDNDGVSSTVYSNYSASLSFDPGKEYNLNLVLGAPKPNLTFGGLYWSSGPMYWLTTPANTTNALTLSDSYTYCNTNFGGIGSSYFSIDAYDSLDWSFLYLRMINLMHNGRNWRIPLQEDFFRLFSETGFEREGSTVGSFNSVHFTVIGSISGLSGVLGILFFPDGGVYENRFPSSFNAYFDKKDISNFIGSISSSDLEYYLNNGCVFFRYCPSYYMSNNPDDDYYNEYVEESNFCYYYSGSCYGSRAGYSHSDGSYGYDSEYSVVLYFHRYYNYGNLNVGISIIPIEVYEATYYDSDYDTTYYGFNRKGMFHLVSDVL